MKSKLVWALVALNAVLLASLALRNGCGRTPPMPNWRHRLHRPRPSDYIMLPGTVQETRRTVIYVLLIRKMPCSARP